MKLFSFFSLLLVASVSGQSSKPVVIAHRGASGYLPEHTLPCKALAHAMGADYLEQDLVLSADNVPMVLHDIWIDPVTDVAARFPDRKREDGRYYALDFTVAELKQLNVNERINEKTGKAVYPGRFPLGKSSFQIPTLEEELEFIAGLNKSTGRAAGIYPEIKQPAWHHQQGRDLSRAVIAILERHGYSKKSDACWLQCFEYEEVKRIRGNLGWRGRLVMLFGGKTGADGTDYDRLRTTAGIHELGKWVDGIGPSLASILPEKSGAEPKPPAWLSQAQAINLVVHPYSVRIDDLPKSTSTIDELHRLLFDVFGVDGVFTDFPDKTAAYVNVRAMR